MKKKKLKKKLKEATAAARSSRADVYELLENPTSMRSQNLRAIHSINKAIENCLMFGDAIMPVNGFDGFLKNISNDSAEKNIPGNGI
jgi:hypothetical protein